MGGGSYIRLGTLRETTKIMTYYKVSEEELLRFGCECLEAVGAW